MDNSLRDSVVVNVIRLAGLARRCALQVERRFVVDINCLDFLFGQQLAIDDQISAPSGCDLREIMTLFYVVVVIGLLSVDHRGLDRNDFPDIENDNVSTRISRCGRNGSDFPGAR